MQEIGLLPVRPWESFYVIVGSSAGALTGLQFVVIVLGAEMNLLAGPTIRAFGTPTIVHFCAVLLISAVLSAPWQTLGSAGLAVGACGTAGFVYAAIVIWHARRQTDYLPVFTDWIWHGVLPLLAHGTLIVAAVLLTRIPVQSLFFIGGAAVLLLFIGIHNAWDAVMYIGLGTRNNPERPGEGK